jgi:hypothetical protein
VVDGMELGHSPEEGKAVVANFGVWKVGYSGTSSVRCQLVGLPLAVVKTYGQEIMETSRMPTSIALLTLYAMRYAVTIPPAIIPSHIYSVIISGCRKSINTRRTVGEVILWLTHMPSFKNSCGHPATSSAVVRAPLTAPIPVVLLSPISARNNPIPHAAAIFKDTGMILTSPTGIETQSVLLSCTVVFIQLTLPHANQRQENENKSFNEHGCESQVVRDDSVTMVTNDLVGEVCVQAHTRC